MDAIEVFKKLRDASDWIVTALEQEDEKETEAAMGAFMLLMVQLDALK